MYNLQCVNKLTNSDIEFDGAHGYKVVVVLAVAVH